MFKKTALSLCFAIVIGLLCSCSPKNPLRLSKNESPAENTKNKDKNENIGTAVALPPAYDRENTPQNARASKLPNGLHALKPSKGMNVNQLFSQKIKSTDKRFDRVENAVVDLRQEFETYKPSIVRLAAVESDIQNLIKELEGLLHETPQTHHAPVTTDNTMAESRSIPTTANAPVPLVKQETQPTKTASTTPPKEHLAKTHTAKPAPQKKKARPPDKKAPLKPKQYDYNVAQNLRIGEHADKVRLVFDANHVVNYTVDLDNDEKIVIVELPQAQWVGKQKSNFAKSKLIESYAVEPMHNGKGSMVILTLRKATKIMTKHRLTPDKTSPYHRVYFDLQI